MSRRNPEIERSFNDARNRVDDARERMGERMHHVADEVTDTAQGWLQRGRAARQRFDKQSNGYSRRMAHAAEDFADEANYHYRRLRRQVTRNPGTTAAIVVGTIGAFFLLRRIFRNSDEN